MNQPRLEARRTLEQIQFSPVKLRGKTWKNLVLKATEDPEQAERALEEYMRAELRAGRTPEI